MTVERYNLEKVFGPPIAAGTLCHDCQTREAEIYWSYGGFAPLHALILCRLCTAVHALALLRDVAELRAGKEAADAGYRDAILKMKAEGYWG